MSVAMKSFERLLLKHLKNITGPLLDTSELGTTPQPPRDGLQLSFQHHQPRHPPPEAHPAQSPGLHLSVNHQLPEGPAAGEAGEHLLLHQINKYWCPPGLCSLPTPFLPLHK
ncbi:hypothetical protein CHARACLAT_023903 [Characodon lateralis]|uniref:Uncharacterized protein n=1 Tax=Characodon lateralis TaxID=208331 RepID=A0ABU7D0U3_9TELE|nr:hypothetical protein [Characodon lateralis]